MSDGSGELEGNSVARKDERGEQAIARAGSGAVAVMAGDSSRPSAFERLLAAVAHVLLLFSLLGTLGATLIWLFFRRRSPYVARQARQAVLWQLLSNVILGIMALIVVVIVVVSFGSVITTPAQHDATKAVFQFSAGLLCLAVLPFCATLYAVSSAGLGALYALLGREYHYPLINRRRARR